LPHEDLFFSTTKGTALRARVSDVPALDRASWGRLVTKTRRGAMLPLDGDTVASLLRLEEGLVPEAAASGRARHQSPAEQKRAGGAASPATRKAEARLAPAAKQTPSRPEKAPARIAGEARPVEKATKAKPEPERQRQAEGKAAERPQDKEHKPPTARQTPTPPDPAPDQIGGGKATGEPAARRTGPAQKEAPKAERPQTTTTGQARRTRRPTVTKPPPRRRPSGNKAS